MSVVILLEFPELFLLHFPHTVVQQAAVVVSNDLSERAAAGAGSNVAEWTQIAPSVDDQVNKINITNQH